MTIIAHDSGAEAKFLLVDDDGRLYVLGTPVDSASCAQVNVGNASTAVLAANAARMFAVFTNDSANIIYLCLGTPAVANRGIRLNANGGQYIIDQTRLYTGQVTAIAPAGASNLTVSEG